MGRQIRALGRIDRGRHGDDEEIAARQIGGLARDRQVPRGGERLFRHLAGGIAPCADLRDAPLVDVEAERRIEFRRIRPRAAGRHSPGRSMPILRSVRSAMSCPKPSCITCRNSRGTRSRNRRCRSRMSVCRRVSGQILQQRRHRPRWPARRPSACPCSCVGPSVPSSASMASTKSSSRTFSRIADIDDPERCRRREAVALWRCPRRSRGVPGRASISSRMAAHQIVHIGEVAVHLAVVVDVDRAAIEDRVART